MKEIEKAKLNAAHDFVNDPNFESDSAYKCFIKGFDAAIQLCEQRERDLVIACNELKYQLLRQHGTKEKIYADIVYGEIYLMIFEELKKHRGENEPK